MLSQHFQNLMDIMEKHYTEMDVTTLLKVKASEYASADMFKVINKINACRIMVKSCMVNFRVGMESKNIFLCSMNHALFAQFFAQYLEYRNELNMLLALKKHDMKGGENKSESNDNKQEKK